ncbi:MAG: glycoside hydrolase family 9 protein [Spirochaetales bacterium]|nr:glycoside hydrolase family 9 protein [Spirochaetales bacterium]
MAITITERFCKTLLFYKAQRSGDLPDDYILPYRADSCMIDGEDVGLDLTGGWYDAGDHVKFGFPMAYSAAQLAWGVYEYRDAFEQAGLLETILDEIKWATDFFIKCHPEADVYYYNCGSGESDHNCWVPPEVVDQFTERTSFKVDSSIPGSDICSMVSSAMSIGSMIFRPTDPAYADLLLTHSRQLFELADSNHGRYPLNNFYQSGGYTDDLTWGAIWLYIVTGEEDYLEKSMSYVRLEELGGHHTQCWDDVSYGAAIKIAQVTKNPEYIKKVEVNLDWWQPNGGLTYTPGGLAYLSNWGALRYASTAAFIAFVWSDDPSVCSPEKRQAYRDFAERQINYALGDNPRESSYVVGFGENASKHPHHRTTHGSWISMLNVPAFHRHILYGALVGGPAVTDDYKDDITDYMLNEVADDYNAGFVGALAKMYSLYGGEPLENWPQPEDFHPPEGVLNEYFTRGWIQWEGPRDLDILFQINNRSACPPRVCTNMSARYFLDLSEVFAAGFDAGDVKTKISSGDAGAEVTGLKQWEGEIYYFDLKFPGVYIHPGHWDIAEKEAIVRVTHPLDNATANDFSYKGLSENPDYDAKSFSAMTGLIPVYEDGVLLWGEEPPGGPATPTPVATPINTPLPELPGDVNHDKRVDIVDALLTAQYYVGMALENFDETMADVDKSGKVNIVDALLIAQFYVGIIEGF